MADTKDFTSLLGKGTGNFKDYAQAYFSQGNKKSNRGRNLFLASILFNGAESKMRAKVQSQLEDLEDEKTFKYANAKQNYDKQLKLQNQYDEIQTQGVSTYYNTQADTAFNEWVETNGLNSSYYDGSNISGSKQRKEFKENFANLQYENFKKVYGEDTARLGSEEEYTKEALEYIKAKRREITRPENLSIIHKGLSKISGGRIGGDYRDKLLEKTKKEKSEYETQEKAALIFNNPIARLNIVGMNAADQAELVSPIQQKNIIIERGQIDNVLESQYGIAPDSLYGKALIQQFQSLPRNDRTVNAFETEVASSITNKFIKENTFIIKEITKKYDGLRTEALYADMDPIEFNALRDKEIRTQLKLPDAKQDIKDAARFYAGLAADMEANADWNRDDPGPDFKAKKKAYLKQKEEEYFENKVAGEFGLKTKAQIKQQLYPTIAIDTATFVASGHKATETAIAGTRIDSTLLKKYQHSDVPEDIDLYNYITNDLKGNTLTSTPIWEKNLEYKSRIELLKQESYVKNLVRNAQYNVDLLMTPPEG
ncbi:MAG: hypothetical protein HOI39_07080 [Flavobacteriales bacterium]|nr:hypothetical protein [Flavobacteriales bacterium]